MSEPDRARIEQLFRAGDLYAALDAARDFGGETRIDRLRHAELARLCLAFDEARGLLEAVVADEPLDVQAVTALAELTLWHDGPAAASRMAAPLVGAGKAPPHLIALLLDSDPALLGPANAMTTDERVPAPQRAALWLAIARDADRAGRHDMAWEAATAGNQLAAAGPTIHWRQILSAHRLLYREVEPLAGHEGLRPLYIVGSPRSGGSLLQSILAALPGACSMGERGALLAPLFERGDTRDRNYLRQVAEADRRGMARMCGAASVGIDKNPAQLFMAGTIARLHPDASFVAMLRDPADTALSIYLRHFPPGFGFATDVGATLDYLGACLDALEAWRDEGLAITLVAQDKFLDDPSGVGRSLAEAVGLAWDEAALDPARRRAPVATFSAAKARQKVSAKTVASSAGYTDRFADHADTIERLRERQAALLRA